MSGLEQGDSPESPQGSIELNYSYKVIEDSLIQTDIPNSPIILLSCCDNAPWIRKSLRDI